MIPRTYRLSDKIILGGDIKDINAIMTALGGKVVYEREKSKDITVMLKGNAIDVKPFVEKGNIYLPAKAALCAMGLKYAIIDNTLSITKGFNTLNMAVGNKTINRFGIEMAATPELKLIDGVMYIPVDYFRDFLGYNVMYYASSNILSINF